MLYNDHSHDLSLVRFGCLSVTSDFLVSELNEDEPCSSLTLSGTSTPNYQVYVPNYEADQYLSKAKRGIMHWQKLFLISSL